MTKATNLKTKHIGRRVCIFNRKGSALLYGEEVTLKKCTPDNIPILTCETKFYVNMDLDDIFFIQKSDLIKFV